MDTSLAPAKPEVRQNLILNITIQVKQFSQQIDFYLHPAHVFKKIVLMRWPILLE